MPIKYMPYTPKTVQGEAILDNITRTQRVLRYRDNGEVHNRIKRGMPYYEVETVEQVGSSTGSETNTENLVLYTVTVWAPSCNFMSLCEIPLL